MSNENAPPPKQDFLAAFLSYLIPGLGQLYQGRIGKGILFLACIYSLFFYGMAQGSWSNVYVPRAARLGGGSKSPDLWKDLYARPQFLGQFWMGIVTWPAIVQYVAYNDEATSGPLFGTWQRTPYESRVGDPTPDRQPPPPGLQSPADFPGKTLNEMQMEDDKSWDLGWVFTVVAGAMNVLVIYDAFAGPAFSSADIAKMKEGSAKNADGSPARA